MGEVYFVATCDAPVEVAFEYLDDYRHVTDYWHGMVSYTPIGDLDQGLGSMFEAVNKIGPSTLATTLKTVVWEKNTRVVYESVSGMDTTTAFEFSATGESACRVEMRVRFRLPGGIAGRAMEKALEPFVGSATRNTAQNMAREINAYHRSRT
ncbi:SRPBCC family protein [Actinophytocola sp.]|uniref:SRPBCC family protein n=1 Tax=Actinophytocola sp. TaxID=1872138 RepID=UPI003D6A4F32